MKKIAMLLLVLAMLMGLCACGAGEVSNVKQGPTNSPELKFNGAYVDKSNTENGRCLLFVVYTLAPAQKNVSVYYYTQSAGSVGSSLEIEMNDTNTYTDAYPLNSWMERPFECTEIENPSEGQEVLGGQSKKFVSAFRVNENDLKANTKMQMTLSTTLGDLTYTVNPLTVQYKESIEDIVKAVDPVAYQTAKEAEMKAFEKVDNATAQSIIAKLNGACFDYGNTELSFTSTRFTVATALGSVGGTYSVRKEAILLNYDHGGQAKVEYEIRNGKMYVSEIEKIDGARIN